MLKRINDASGLFDGNTVTYKGGIIGVGLGHEETTFVMGFFEDRETGVAGEAEVARVSISYNSLELWDIVRKTPDKVMGWENPKSRSLSVTTSTMDDKLSKYPKYKEACMFMKQAHKDIVKFKYIGNIKTVAQGRIMKDRGRRFEVSEPRMTHYSSLVSTYLMEGTTKVRLSFNGVYFIHSRYRTNEDIKPYWSHNYTLAEAAKLTKYREIVTALELAHIKAYKGARISWGNKG